MTVEDRIQNAISGCGEQLAVVSSAIEREVVKPIRNRRTRLLLFLYKEKEIYTFALAQLKSLLEDTDAEKSIPIDFSGRNR